MSGFSEWEITFKFEINTSIDSELVRDQLVAAINHQQFSAADWRQTTGAADSLTYFIGNVADTVNMQEVVRRVGANFTGASGCDFTSASFKRYGSRGLAQVVEFAGMSTMAPSAAGADRAGGHGPMVTGLDVLNAGGAGVGAGAGTGSVASNASSIWSEQKQPAVRVDAGAQMNATIAQMDEGLPEDQARALMQAAGTIDDIVDAAITAKLDLMASQSKHGLGPK